MRPIVIELPKDLDTKLHIVEVLVQTDGTAATGVDIRHDYGVWTPISMLGGRWSVRD